MKQRHGVPVPTQRLAFREMTTDDVDDMAALLGDPDVMRYYPRPKDRDEVLAWIHWNQRKTLTDDLVPDYLSSI